MIPHQGENYTPSGSEAFIRVEAYVKYFPIIHLHHRCKDVEDDYMKMLWVNAVNECLIQCTIRHWKLKQHISANRKTWERMESFLTISKDNFNIYFHYYCFIQVSRCCFFRSIKSVKGFIVQDNSKQILRISIHKFLRSPRLKLGWI